MSITLRRTKWNGSPAPLTNDELDDNFVFLNNEILKLVDPLNGEFRKLSDRITNNLNSIGIIGIDLSSIHGQIEGINVNIGALLAKDIIHESDINTINLDITSIKSRVTNLETTTTNLINRPFTSDSSIIIEKTTHVPAAINIKASDLVVQTTKTQTLTNKSISGASNTFTNIPSTALIGKVSIVNGGTNADSAATARTNLGLEIGKDVQAYNSLTVIADRFNTFTNINTFKDTGFRLWNGNQVNNKQVEFRLSAVVNGGSNHILNIPEKSGTLATLDDIDLTGTLKFSDINTRVLAYSPYVVQTNKNNHYDNEVYQVFPDNFFVLRGNVREFTTARFEMGSAPDNANIVMGIPPASGILATQEYVESRFGGQVVTSFTTPGFYVMPGGLILQWGSQLINQTQHPPNLDGLTSTSHTHSRTFGAITFPRVFPNACFSVTATPRDSTSAYIDGCEMAIGIVSKGNTNFTYLVNRINGNTSWGAETTMFVDFIAIGW